MNEASTAEVSGLVRRSERRFCLVTTEFHGLFKNGGIGTANTGLALALAGAGYDVTVAFADADESGPRGKTGDFAAMCEYYRGRGIRLDYVRPHPSMSNAFDDTRAASYCVLLYLLGESFDVVLFNDNGGLGYYPLLAKYTGIFTSPPSMCVVTHGPIEWVLELNAREYDGRDQVTAIFMEQRVAALADVLVSPSRYLIDWMTSKGWTMPPRTLVIQNIIGTLDEVVAPPGAPPRRAISEIVFFGRQEVRKGLSLFCDAVDLLHRSVDLAAITITFLGKFEEIGGLHSGVYLAERTRRWKTTTRIAVDYDQGEALDHLRQPGVLAVMPSLAENSPCVVMECLIHNMPFLATDSGGTPELVLAEDRPSCLFAPDPAALASRLAQVLCGGQVPARPAVSPNQTYRDWMRLLDALAGRDRGGPQAADRTVPPLVSICLVHTRASPCARAAFEALLAQTWPRIEVLIGQTGDAPTLLDDGGPLPASIQLLEIPSLGRGAVRDHLARQATGDYLLFTDETAVLLAPDCVQTLLTAAARTGADILTGLASIELDRGSADQRALMTRRFPIGGCRELGALENCFGEGVVFISASAYRRGDGFPRDCDDSILDWLFLATAELGGCTQQVVPKPIFQRRAGNRWHFDAGHAVQNHRRILHAYRDEPTSVFAHVIETALRIKLRNQETIDRVLRHASAAARQVARRLTTLPPNGADARRCFVEYCCERRLIELATGFALMNDFAMIPDAIAAVRRVAETAARDAIGTRRIGFWHDLDLTAEAQQLARPIAPLANADLTRAPGTVVAHALQTGVSSIKLMGLWPPGTARITATVAVEPSSSEGGTQVAIVVCRSGARIVLTDAPHGLNGDQANHAWSGWITIQGQTLVSAGGPESTADQRDVFLLSRDAGSARPSCATIVWRRVVAELSMNGNVSGSTIAAGVTETTLPPEVIAQGQLLSDVSAFPFPVFVPGKRTLLHPLPGKTALVRLPGALPPGASGLGATVSVGHEQSHPVEFAIWLRPAAEAAMTPAELLETEGFSGWLTVDEPLVQYRLDLALGVPASGAMDVYVATRVTSHGNVDFCHAYWNEFWTTEPVWADTDERGVGR